MSNAECNKNNIRQLSYKFILTYLASIEPKNLCVVHRSDLFAVEHLY